MQDLERARAWWVRQMGYLSTTDERKVESLAAEFNLVRRDTTIEVLRAAVDMLRTHKSPERALDRIMKLIDKSDSAATSERFGSIAGPCNRCGKTEHADGSPVTWLCISCMLRVCCDCALTIPGRIPAEYYDDTLCSRACWEAIGKPEE